MKNKKEFFISIGLNIIIVIFAIIGLILKLIETKTDYFLTFAFFTYFLTIINGIILIYQEIRYLKYEVEITKNVKNNKYIITIMQALIMVYWVFILAPLAGNDFLSEYIFKGGSLFLHALCPLLSIISFLGYDNFGIEKRNVLTSLVPTIIYGALIIILNFTHILIGPYGFFEVYYSPYGVIILTPIALLLIELVIGLILYLCKSATSKVKKTNQ